MTINPLPSVRIALLASLEETRKAFDLTAFHGQFVQGKEAREGTFAASIINAGIEAAYNEAKSAADRTKG
jgi:hypothetical protein